MKAVFYASKIAGKLKHENPEKLKAFIAGLKPTIRQKITIEKYVQKRSNPQNNYYFGVVVDMIVKETGSDKDTVHAELKKMFLLIKDGKIPIVGSTKKLSTIDFNEYINQCVLWSAEWLGVVIPDPNYPDGEY